MNHYNYDENYAREYLKHNPDGQIVCIVSFQNQVVGLYTPAELLSATIPYPSQIEYRPVIGWSSTQFKGDLEAGCKQPIGWGDARKAFGGFSQNEKNIFKVPPKTEVTFTQNKPEDGSKRLII